MSSELLTAAELLVGKEVWAIVAGSGTGSAIHVLMGDQIKRNVPLRNPNLSAAANENDASHSLFVQCAWRLDAIDRILTGGWDSNHEGGPMLTALAALVGDNVQSVWIGRPGLDLDVTFASGATLRVFCDQINEVDDDPNYSLRLPDTVFTVGCRSKIRSSAR